MGCYVSKILEFLFVSSVFSVTAISLTKLEDLKVLSIGGRTAMFYPESFFQFPDLVLQILVFGPEFIFY